ncbi:exopolysaccharide biosynthesis polyprenyl glycosylphosphotransferase subfamily [Verrucomicrobiia bacterium DG1235]|nr:exopolysaccharide biosynthesis polyprenyl glycosylphosphotransferase subfamily [Verrucomicrobiae bacterium DG1235]
MLKNRQEGILNLHGLWQAACLLILFLVVREIFHQVGYRLRVEYLNLYMAGIVIGSFANVRLLKTYAEHFVNMGWFRTFYLTFQQLIRIMLLQLAVVFALKDTDISRLFLSSFFASAFVLLFAMNKILPKHLCRLSFKTQVIPTLIIGSTKSLKSLENWITNKTDYGIEIIGYAGEETCPPASEQPIPCMGTIDDLSRSIEQNQIAQVVIVDKSLSPESSKKAMSIAQKAGCRVRIYNNWQDDFQQRIVVEHEGDYTFLTYENEPLENPINRMVKRSFDVAVSLPIVAFILPPLTLLVWAFQRKQSPGPIFYAQPRTGMTKRTFHIIKYRTMHVSEANQKNVAKQATKGDSRIYAFGSFLRKTSLDELPQFINVLLGEMSVSGPRPHLIDHDREFSEKLQVYYTRHFVKPGITGLAQSLGLRGEIENPDLLKARIDYDIKYINTWSFMLDLKIMLRTAKAVFFPPESAR